MLTTRDIRFRTDFPEEDVIEEVRYNGAFQSATPLNRWRRYHWMADKINLSDRRTKRRPPGFCQHLKLDKTYMADWWSYTNGSTFVEVHNPDRQMAAWSPTGENLDPLDHGWSNALANFFQTPRFSDLCLEAWIKLKTQVPTEVQFLNFIYELKDFKELGKSLSKARNLPGKSTKEVFAAPLKGRGKGRKAAKAVNNTFLSYNFMWAPFIGDLIKLTTVADSVAKRMAFLRETRGKEVTIRFSKPDCYINSDLGAHQTVWQNDDWDAYHLLTKYQCDFYVTCKLYQDLEGLDDAWANLRATFAALGINNPVKAFWNAIPFSFLVDWIGPFGTWLEKAAVQPFKGTWNVYDITTSVRERGVVQHRAVSKPGRNLVSPDSLLTEINIDRYTRLVGLPQTLGAFDFSQLTQQQQKLFLSLVLTKVL